MFDVAICGFKCCPFLLYDFTTVVVSYHTNSCISVHLLANTLNEGKDKYEEQVDIEVFVSKAGDQVIKYYEISHEIETKFDKVWVEINANSPFLAGNIQLGKYEFMLVAPGTSNTVAKIALRMGDTLISNAAIMGQKADIPLYILPADYEEGIIVTKLPDGKDLKEIYG